MADLRFSIVRECARSWAVFSIWLQDSLAYRASGVIWVLTDTVNTAVMPLVWISASGGGLIGGYTANQFVAYYLSMMLIGSFVTCHFMWDISSEIREGNFTVYLIRPISYFWFMLVRNFAWRIIRTTLSIPIFLVVAIGYHSYLSDMHLNASILFWVSLLLGHLVSYTFVIAFAMLALVITETRSVFELYYIPMLFLSGQLFPISLLPDWAQRIAYVFPFYYTTGVPTEILVGRLGETRAMGLVAGQLGWILVCVFLQRLLWRFGLRHYTGVGM